MCYAPRMIPLFSAISKTIGFGSPYSPVGTTLLEFATVCARLVRKANKKATRRRRQSRKKRRGWA